MKLPFEVPSILTNTVQDVRDLIHCRQIQDMEIRQLNVRLGRLELERDDLLDIIQSQADTLIADQAEIDRLRAMLAHPAVAPISGEEWIDQVDEIRNLPEHRLV